MENPNEIWQVEVNGEVYDTDFIELTNWVLESSVMETDKVRRGNLRWLEAGKVPLLKEFFNAREQGIEPPQVQVSTIDVNETQAGNINQNTETTHNLTDNQLIQNTTLVEDEPFSEIEQNFENTDKNSFETDTTVCTIHPDLSSDFLCTACSHAFCKECPNSYSGSVKTCPYCGGLCQPVKDVRIKTEREIRFRRDISKGFGFEDFGKALAFPFKYKTSLVFGGLMFAFFSYGQGAASMGSMFLVAAALICFMFANALTFGVLANTIDNFSQGFTDKNFMPSFDDFNIWDDVVHPFFLSIAVWVSSFGLFIALIIGGVWYAWNSFSGAVSDPTQSSVALMPEQDSVQTIDHVKQVTEKLKKQNEARMNLEVGEDGLTDAQRATVDEEAEFQRLNDLVNNHRKQQLESTIGKTPETQEKEMQVLVSQFMQFAGIFLILAGLTFLWGLFYFPAACAVAGYTRSFTATLNPLVGFDTIKHLGFDYIKLVAIYIVLLIMSAIIGSMLSSLFSPFDLPTFGNLPAKVIGSFVTFYFSVAFAVTLGFVIYKNSEKLKLYRG